MGADGQDVQFKSNWKNAKANNYLRGAYHYYRPNENSVLQFENFSKMVKLDPGDFPPVLDIEEMGKYVTENSCSRNFKLVETCGKPLWRDSHFI